MDLLNSIQNIVRFCKITGAADNSSQFPAQQVTLRGKVSTPLMVFPYGVYANVSTTDGLGLLFSIGGNEDNKGCIGYTPQKRPGDLEENEVAVYHPYSDSFIKFRNDGSLEIQAKMLNVSGDIDLTGSMSISGDLTVGGATALSDTVTSNGLDISSTHTHIGSATAPPGAISPTGAVAP